MTLAQTRAAARADLRRTLTEVAVELESAGVDAEIDANLSRASVSAAPAARALHIRGRLEGVIGRSARRLRLALAVHLPGKD